MVIVITGATKGIGKAIARKLAEGGHQLAICARTGSDLEDLKEELLDKTPCESVFVSAVDVRDRRALTTFGKDVLDTFQRVDVLVNNAGIFIPGKFVDEEMDIFDQILETNLFSACILTKQLLPSMIARKQGHIINICSVASIQPYPNGGSYGISKHALLGFGKTLREEVREFGIRVTNILPGATWTDSWSGTDFPRERLIDPVDVAHVVNSAIELESNAVMEEVIIRPILGDLG